MKELEIKPASSHPTASSLTTGWGRYPACTTVLRRPESSAALNECLKSLEFNSSLARGLGRSYGDAAVNPDGQTILMERMNRMLMFDESNGIVRCEPGVTIQDLIETFLPRGWFPAVVPGTKHVTVGGAIAGDIHGKNHHCDGTFCNSVRSFKLLCANGQLVDCSQENNTDLFWATAGGMGLTGLITEVEFALQKIPSSYIQSLTVKAKDLDEALAAFDRFEAGYQYSAAWIDCLSSNRSLGRSVLFFGNHAQLNDLTPQQKTAPFYLPVRADFEIMFDAPSHLLNKFSGRAFNEFYWMMHTNSQENKLVNCLGFFFPLDRLGSWNRLYGRKGFVQYQCVLPLLDGRESLIKLLQLLAQEKQDVFLAVLKRFGAEHGLLSFPKPGYTLTLDMPVTDSLFPFITRLNQVVCSSGGRVYLAKDAFLKPDEFRSMYPHYSQWLSIKNKIDPNNMFRSALSDRLNLGQK
jgi:decaprenylphospho-beta-D-ribofuranose 2-oxidase